MLILDQHRSPGRRVQQSGMTRNGSPVYFIYPPDPSGRQANQAIQLQYAGLSQRAASDAFAAQICDRGSTSTQPSEAAQRTPLIQPTGVAVPRTFEQIPTDGFRDVERRRTATGYASSLGSNDPTRYERIPRTRTAIWYCCQGGGFGRTDHGPYNVELSRSCLVCDHRGPCAYCIREVVEIRDRYC